MKSTSKIFTLDNDNVILSVEVLNVPALKEVYDKFGLSALSYLWGKYDPESPYKRMEEERREEKLIEIYSGDYSPHDLEIVNAAEFLKELYSTPKSRLHEGAKIMMDRFSKYLKDTPLDDDNQIGNFDKVIKFLEKMDKVLANFDKAEQAREAEMKKGRGGKQIGLY